MKQIFPTIMPSARCHFRLGQTTVLALLVALLTFATPAAHAADLLWDANNVTPDAQDGSGTWTNTASNWRNLTASTDNQKWTNSLLNSAIFGAGTDGTYAITLAGTVQAGGGITFSNSGYTLSGTALILTNLTTVNSPITVAANKTATINSQITYRNNSAANITNETGATLNLGGGAGNSQYSFVGGGLVNMTAGTYSANIGKVNVPTFNQRGGTFNITPGNNNGYDIGNNAGQSVNYTLTNAILTVNGNANTPGVVASCLALGRNLVAGPDYTPYTNTLTVQNGATVNIGTTASRAGELRIGASTNASGKLNVQGGTVTIGTGDTANKIYFFKAGSSAGYTATMTQSGGTVTANGIQFCEVPATLDLASSATLQLSGGSLYVGAQGITLGAGASALPVTIQLQGGTLGANQNWSSSLDMKLGITGGGPTIRAQDAASTARNITLSGILSDDGAVNGTLTKTGSGTLTLSGASANTFTGPTLVSAGTLNLGKISAVSSSSSVTIASGAALALSTGSSTVPNLTFITNGTLSFNVADGYSLTVSGTDGVTNSGPAGSVTINITGSAPADGTNTLISYSGALQGSGFGAYTLGSTPAGKSYALNDTGSAVELIVSNPFVWTGLDSTEWSTNIIAGLKNWTQGGSPTDYANGQAVVFDDTATNYTVDISVVDVTPSAVTFNNSGTNYTLQGSKAIAGSTSLTKTGTGALTILNANSYTGGSTLGTTVANEGTVGIGHNNALGSGKITSLGAQLQAVGGARTLTNALDISAGGLRFGGGNDLTLSGAITMVGSRDIGIHSPTNTLTLSGGVNLSGYNFTLRGNAGNVPNGTNIISAPITGSGNFAVSADFTNGTAILTAPNTYTGTTTIGSGTLRLGASEVIPDGAGSGTVTVTGTLDLNGFSETINGLSGAGIVDTIAGGTPTLTVGNGNGTADFTGIIQSTAGTLALVKTGTGTQTLRGANTFSGGVTIKNGTLDSRTTTTTLGTGMMVMGGTGSTNATFITGINNTNAFRIDPPDSGTSVIGANGTGSGFVMSGPITLNGANLNVRTFTAGTTANVTLSGGVTGTGNLLLNNLSTTTGKVQLSGANPINNIGTITSQGVGTNANVISAVIGANVTGVIQNSATCPLILSATNTYTGPTIVNAGTLVIQVASLAASSTVSVAANGVLQLDFTTTNVVAGFSTNGVSLPAGVYGAAEVAPFIAGSGSLEVAAAGPSGPATLTNSVSGNTLTLTWPAGEFWRLEGQTNSLSSGLNPATNAWFTVPGGVDGSNGIPVNSANPTVFYRLVYP